MVEKKRSIHIRISEDVYGKIAAIATAQGYRNTVRLAESLLLTECKLQNQPIVTQIKSPDAFLPSQMTPVEPNLPPKRKLPTFAEMEQLYRDTK
ncbi:MAG: hypothetical protein ABH863_03165 [Candidatus Micrarchaeota archaeon]